MNQHLRVLIAFLRIFKIVVFLSFLLYQQYSFQINYYNQYIYVNPDLPLQLYIYVLF